MVNEAVASGDDAGTTVSHPSGDEVVNENLRMGRRSHKPSVLLRDFVTYSARCGQDPIHAPLVHPTESFGTCFYPISHYVACHKFSARHRAFVAQIDAGVEPTRFAEAMKNEKWREAMRAKIQALEANGTWTLTTLPAGQKAIGNK